MAAQCWIYTWPLLLLWLTACRDGTAKIGDVGMAKILAREYVTGVVGTLAW